MAIPPPWPRPVSPLHYEPISPLHHETYLDESSSSDDGDPRDAKRRRIEELGQRYLRGYGLFISTAQIKGPLGKDWENPWSRKSRKGIFQEIKHHGKEIVAKEVPETVQKIDHVLIKNDNKSNLHLPLSKPTTAAQNSVQKLSLDISSKAPESATRPILGQHVDEDPFKSSSALKSRSKVEDWLKRDQGIMRQRPIKEADGPSSPTSRFTAINAVRNGPAHPEKPLLNSIQPQIGKRDGVQPPAHSAEDRSSNLGKAMTPTGLRLERPEERTQVKAENSHSEDRTTHPACSVIEVMVAPTRRTPQKTEQGKKATAMRQSLDAVPPSTHLPEFEFRRVVPHKNDQARQVGDIIDETFLSGPSSKVAQEPFRSSEPRIVKDHGAILHDTPQGERNAQEKSHVSVKQLTEETHAENHLFASTVQRKVYQEVHPDPLPDRDLNEGKVPGLPPSLTTATSNKSNATETNNIPSAQRLSNPQNPVSLSSLPSTKLDFRSKIHEAHQDTEDELVEDSVLFLSTQAAVERAQRKFQTEFETPKPLADSLQQKNQSNTKQMYRTSMEDADQKSDDSKPPPRRQESLSSAMVTPIEPSIQAMIDAVTPFAFSTTKKVPLKSANGSIPRAESAMKAPLTKNKKRASFALDIQESNSSSQSSIRSALKVTKAATPTENKILPRELQPDIDKAQQGPPSHIARPSTDNLDKAGKQIVRADMDRDSKESFPNLSSLLRDPSGGAAPPVSSEAKTATQTPFNLTAPTTSLSSRQRQDAQPRPHIGAVDSILEDEADFDLEATMDDLGSFLQSWDPEKEAKNVGGGQNALNNTGRNSGGKRDWKGTYVGLPARQ